MGVLVGVLVGVLLGVMVGVFVGDEVGVAVGLLVGVAGGSGKLHPTLLPKSPPTESEAVINRLFVAKFVTWLSRTVRRDATLLASVAGGRINHAVPVTVERRSRVRGDVALKVSRLVTVRLDPAPTLRVPSATSTTFERLRNVKSPVMV